MVMSRVMPGRSVDLAKGSIPWDSRSRDSLRLRRMGFFKYRARQERNGKHRQCREQRIDSGQAVEAEDAALDQPCAGIVAERETEIPGARQQSETHRRDTHG